MNQHIEIVCVAIQDLETLRNLGIETFRKAFGHLNSPENMEDYLNKAFAKEQIAKEINHPESKYYFAKKNNIPIAYLKINFENAQTELKDPKALEIERIYVHHQYQGQGLGRKLIQKAISIARKKELAYIWLGVWDENIDSIEFYKKNGFVPFNQHSFLLGDELQTDIMMKRVLLE